MRYWGLEVSPPSSCSNGCGGMEEGASSSRCDVICSLRKGSASSLIASGVFASLYLTSGYMISNAQEGKGHTLAAVSGITLSGAMALRFIRTGSFMPAGLVACLGGSAFIVWICKAFTSV